MRGSTSAARYAGGISAPLALFVLVDSCGAWRASSVATGSSLSPEASGSLRASAGFLPPAGVRPQLAASGKQNGPDRPADDGVVVPPAGSAPAVPRSSRARSIRTLSFARYRALPLDLRTTFTPTCL